MLWLTDLGGEFAITLRASISILSVLLLVRDSELDARGSITAAVWCGPQHRKHKMWRPAENEGLTMGR
jgi:hypothetical protein